VEELELDPGVDTLARWMAHHLAELIDQADNAADPAVRAKASEQAVSTILRLWEHRSAYKRINPLADLAPALSVLRALGAGAPPWMRSFSGSSGNAAQLVYDLLRRLVICLSCWELDNIGNLVRALNRAQLTTPWQTEEESKIVDHLSLWAGALMETVGDSQDNMEHSSANVDQKRDTPTFAELVHSVLDELETALSQLRAELPGPDSREGHQTGSTDCVHQSPACPQ
jgi:hypothetical protein